ncbi:histidinol dehydrogenase [Flavihumibacter sp. R14]|nr:histidinol dehydrogenase [Flavihumibacter soli]
MLKLYNLSNLSESEIQGLCDRNADEDKTIQVSVNAIISEVRQRGDEALKAYAKEFDGVDLEQLYIGREEIALLAESVPAIQKEAIDIAYKNIQTFHLGQVCKEDVIETMPGVSCWRDSRAIEKVGLYIPGGTAVLPSTFLMLGVPARIAGCEEIIVCSPPQKSGLVNAYIAYCAQLLHIEKIYLVGGAQAVAAMAFGTESITKVDKIFGPGNQYVTTAKSIIQSISRTAIDMPAGPSEVLVIADESSNPVFVAADLSAQAEHGIDSQVVLVSTSSDIIDSINKELERQIPSLPRAAIASQALKNSYSILVKDLNEAMEFSNAYAPEHLILATPRWGELTDKIKNAGSVFLGNYTPESAGDYASGTNHTLPTGSYARSYSGVSVDSFVKKITFQYISAKGIQNIGPTVEILAELEGLEAHKNAVSVRLLETFSRS